MARQSHVFAYCYLTAAVSGATLFALADIFYLVAAFRPDRSPELVMLLNDMARRGGGQRADHRGGSPAVIHQGTHDHSILHGSAHRTAVAQAVHRRVAHRAVGRGIGDLPI